MTSFSHTPLKRVVALAIASLLFAGPAFAKWHSPKSLDISHSAV